MSLLDEIFAHKRVEIAQQQARSPLAEVRARPRRPPPLDFVAALRAAQHAAPTPARA